MRNITIIIFLLFILLPFNLKAGQSNLEVAYETSSYSYREPHLDHPISLKSNKNGFSLAYRRDNIYSSFTPNFALLEFRYMTGDNTYNGWLQEGFGVYTPFSSSGIEDSYLEGALKIGRTFIISNNFETQAIFGFGLRHLRDNLQNIGEGGYLRKSSYIYIPLEAIFNYHLTSNFKLSLKSEFDLLVSGEQYSGKVVGYISSTEVYSSQKEGYGLRASFKMSAKTNLGDFFIEPFWRYWHIQNSDKQYQYLQIGTDWYRQTVWEPFNITREYGIKIGFLF